MSFQLYNDKVYTFPIAAHNALGASQPWGATNPLAVSSNPASLGARVIWQAPSFFLVLTPAVQASPGLSVTVSYTGMASATLGVDIVPDPDLVSVAIDSSTATSVSQNVPTAPGP